MQVGPVTTIKHGKPVPAHEGAAPAHTEPAGYDVHTGEAVIHPAHKPHGKPFANLNFGDASAHQEHPAELNHEPPAPDPAAVHVEDHQEEGVYTVGQLQAVLRGLGWTGRNTTSGAVQVALRDNLYGPVTAEDWQRSATKRDLDPTIVRIDGTHAHVAPETYRALVAVARSKGANVSGRRPMYIP
jgi:hypothetical protein